MYEQLITFETAKLAKENKFGLDSYTGFVFDENGVELDLAFYAMEDKYARPRQSLLQKWLRDEHGVDIIILLANTNRHCYIGEIWQTIKNKPVHSLNLSDSDTYEEALEKGLQEALKLIK